MRHTLEIDPPFLFSVNMYEAGVESVLLSCVFCIAASSVAINCLTEQRCEVFFRFRKYIRRVSRFCLGKLIASESCLDANEVAGVFRFFEREESHTH